MMMQWHGELPSRERERRDGAGDVESQGLIAKKQFDDTD